MKRTVIGSDALVAITQTCVACKGEETLGVRSWCRVCNHHYSESDWEMVRRRDAEARVTTGEPPDKQPCGHSWRDLYEEDVLCRECDGNGVQHLRLTLAELAGVLAPEIARALVQTRANAAVYDDPTAW